MTLNNPSPPLHGVGQELTRVRVFDAPRALVFKLWIDPKHVAQWWGPRCFTNPRCELDARPGGAIRIDMAAPDGAVYPMTGVYREVVEPEKIVFVSAALDAQGKAMFEVLNTVTFAERDGKTTLTLHAKVISATAVAPQYLAGMEAGWTETLDGFEEHLANVR